jgi:hypothetical protein
MNNGLIAKFNARSEFKNMKGESDPRYGKYVSDYEKLFAKTMDESLREMGGGISPSGRFTAKVHRNPGGLPTIVIRDSQIQHAAGDMPMEFSYKLVVDKNGYITSVKKDGFSMAQSTVLEVEDFLSHHGVRGQKWGVRNKRQFFKKGVRGDFHYRTGGQKTGLIAGGVAGWMTGGVAAQAMLKHFGQNPVTGLAALGTQIGVSVAGVRLARGFMDRHGRDHMSAARKKYTQKQAIRQVKQHLKNNPGG